MAGTIAAPKNGQNMVGVAWKSNLVVIRNHDVVWDGSATDVWHTGSAIDTAAANYGAEIITMAFQASQSSGYVEDKIEYWYEPMSGRDRLFVAAAGTAPCWTPVWFRTNVVFPANLPEVVAVAGLDADTTVACDSFRGTQVEEAVYIVNPTTGNRSLSDDAVATNSGSSNGAAIVAGIAALVWSQHPTWTRDQVRQRLHEASEGHGQRFNYAIGYGQLNAFGAVGGFWDATISGPNALEPDEPTGYQYTATPYGGSGSYSYSWAIDPATIPLSGASTPTVTVTVDRSDEPGFTLILAMVDLQDGAVVVARDWRSIVPCDEEDPECEV